ncbi:RNA polymerase-binding protein DksA [Helicobacter burdigaliensis]|uniref:RNA polymerase-binding protein DksA n=1 Tax=Helicobacter burdigaliensis TaxID=2315334 RepID=UPI000EF6C6D8|nr:RNA polymerase-binding protein DksA [Helicobacter burdigaliensis]
MRHSDLEKFKKLLLEQKEAILANNKEHCKSMEVVRSGHLGDEVDIATMSIKNRLDESIFERHAKELEFIDIALAKIEEGSYGICEMCEEEINFQRLKAKPHARYCIVCREIIEKDKGK